MTVRVYSSGDASAPVLRGNTPGDFINVLTKCLVDGYGSKTAAGWTKPYTGTNIAVFRQGSGSNGMYLRVDDTDTTAGNSFVRVVGYENMSDVNTGSPISFPTTGQIANGLYWYKKHSNSTAANARPWKIVASEKFFWIFLSTYPEYNYANNYYNEAYCFGDLIPTKSGDTTHTILLGSTVANSPNTTDNAPWTGQSISAAGGSRQAISVARSYTALGGPQWLGWHGDHVKGLALWGAGNLSYPHSPDGGLYLSPVMVHEPMSSPYNVRGRVPGLWQPLHNLSYQFSQFQEIEGTGDMLDKTFMLVAHYNCSVLIEISDTWYD